MMTGALMTILVGVAEFSSQASFISMKVLSLCKLYLYASFISMQVLSLCKSCHTPNLGDSCYHIEMCIDSLNRS